MQRWHLRLFPGGDGGFALCLQDDLEAGFSEPCDTFKSGPLCKGYFKIQAMEVWGIQNSISLCHSLSSVWLRPFIWSHLFNSTLLFFFLFQISWEIASFVFHFIFVIQFLCIFFLWNRAYIHVCEYSYGLDLICQFIFCTLQVIQLHIVSRDFLFNTR